MANTESLSDDLRPIYEIEMRLGNVVKRVDAFAWTECPLAVIFRDPLHLDEIASQVTLAQTVEYWESRDSHYDVEAGYFCQKTGHSVAGPIYDGDSRPQRK